MRSASTLRESAPWLEPSPSGRRSDQDAAPLPGGGSAFDLALFSCGDERVFLDPATGRTKYGTPRGCAEDEIWLSSSTASAVSAFGYAAAAGTWQSLVTGRETLNEQTETVRRRLIRLFGIDGTQAILAGSGTEAILLGLAMVRMACGRHLTTLIVGAAETGRGVSAAAAGRHFLRYAAFAEVVPGECLAGLEDFDVCIETIAIRDPAGTWRGDAAIDAELLEKCQAARRLGRDVLIVRLDVSKTGLSAPSLAAIVRAQELAPGHVFTLADCCQLRCSPAHVKGLLVRGFLVAVTGSKFAGGPPFCGALFVPPGMADAVWPEPLPAGFAAYSAQSDWPLGLRTLAGVDALPNANVGLALRWQASLAEIERFLSLPQDVCSAIITRFGAHVRRHADQGRNVDLVPWPAERDGDFKSTILCLAMRHQDLTYFDTAETLYVQRLLRDGPACGDRGGRPIHLGQPVGVGPASAVRICLGAATINPIAEAMVAGASLAQAFAPLAEAISDVFAALAVVTEKPPEHVPEKLHDFSDKNML